MDYFAASADVLMIVAVILMAFLHEYERRRLKKQSLSKNFDSEATSSVTEYVKNPPGPLALPLLGHTHLMARYQLPHDAFAEFQRRYGNVVNLRLGSIKCVLISGMEAHKEVLITKATSFDSRPGFHRYHMLFGNNKENSLAFCNWSDVHRMRRDMLKDHVFPRPMSPRFDRLDDMISVELNSLVDRFPSQNSEQVYLKPLLLTRYANIFTSYFCNQHFEENDPELTKMVEAFDKIFYEVNQGYALDFFPWLLPFYKNHLSKISEWTHTIRHFITDVVIEPRKSHFVRESNDMGGKNRENTLLEALLSHLEDQKDKDGPTLTWDSALFALEDIIGGHSAVANFVMRLLSFVVCHPEVQERIFTEIIEATGSGGRAVVLQDRLQMPYTEATVYEAIRLTASPIVPHVANQSSSIGGYFVPQDTVILFNNYELNKSPSLWQDPESFQPERFVVNGQLSKPDFFIPFSTGRRACLGYKLIQYISFLTLATLVQNYHLVPVDGVNYDIQPGSLALPYEAFPINLSKRST